MAINATQLFLLAYDIADPKRLQQVHRTVRSAGIPIQYSVFLVPGPPRVIDALLSRLDDIIHPTHDDIRVYPLPKRLEVTRYGRQHMPIGLDLIQGGHLQQAFLDLVGSPEAEGY
ncbi:CRISPR-associated endonuclease Cas2 [Thiorhodococcus mannitoliphagus]|uniref:CRISPR-associated endoribonuclease Cas2 n=1 Tax=Thiorhodococcus mannitoliphagus TaxID=329406 RepID=A0A6P1E1Q3_9GAMM|nr:CRISPR-associated endonuclease Cas2 [Thiorhodococcus mannitoliphagus]NEX22432.1 CRISPR-associated endonuclease Cas2 [Thiorhodococcus mannitoliphagus]